MGIPDRFTVHRTLGEGGFGAVFEAEDSETGQRVALKQLQRVGTEALLRFKREFRSLVDLRHENLVRLGELVSDGNDWFLTMELVEGSSITDYVTSGGRSTTTTTTAPASRSAYRSPYDESRLRGAFTQLADGVNAIHEYGLIHRDLKPSNVLVDRRGRVVILDFGLVKHLGPGEVTRSTQIVGTPSYMSPEQAEGIDMTPATDWYTVGVMLFQALTGELPFVGTLYEIILKRHSESPPVPSSRSEGVPADLDELCVALMAREPADRPGHAQVSAVLGRPTSIHVPEDIPLPADEPFVGRAEELNRLAEAAKRVRRGEAAVVLVQGRSGIGKSALVRHFVREMERDDPGVLVLRSRCYRRESVPYKAFDGLLDALTTHLARLDAVDAARFLPRDWPALARLFPVLRELGDQVAPRRGAVEIPDAKEARRRGFRALRECLGRLGDEKLLVASIEDLQWGDLESAVLLRELVRLPEAPPLLFLATFRSDERASSPMLRALESGLDVPIEEIELTELTDAEAVDLALAQLGTDDDESRERAKVLARECGGSPFFMNELVRHDAVSGGGTMDTLRLNSVIESRLDRLPEDARRLLDFFAVAGRPLELSVANQAAGLDPGHAGAIDRLRTDQWVRERAGSGREVFEPYHDRIREMVAELVPQAQLPTYHNRLAAALEGAGHADAETLAEHYLRSGEEELAGRHALRAADQAAEALAFDRAARLYAMGFDLWTPDSAELRLGARQRWGEALANAGRGEESARTFLDVSREVSGRRRLELRTRAAEQLLVSGSIDEGLEILRGALDEVGMRLPTSPRRALLGLLWRRLQLKLRGLDFSRHRESEVDEDELLRVDMLWAAAKGLAMVDIIRAAYFQSKTLLFALRAGEPFRVARALILEYGASSTALPRSAKRTALLRERCRALVTEVDEPYIRGWFTTLEAVASTMSGRFRDALPYSREAESILREECTGVTWERDSALLYELHSLVNLGRWRELAERSDEVMEDALERRDLYMTTYIRTRGDYIHHLLDDDPSGATEAQQAALGNWSRQGFHVQHYWDWYVRGEIDLYAGRPTAGWARITGQWKEWVRSQLPLTRSLAAEVRFLRARLGLACAVELPAEQDRYLAQVESDRKWLAGEGTDWTVAMALAVQAGRESIAGDRETARANAREASIEFEALGIEHYHAALAHRAGAGQDSPALAWFDEQRVKNPERMLRVLAPGRWGPGPEDGS